MSDLHPIRRLYRRYLSPYAWARKLKPYVVKLWFNYLSARHWVSWNITHEIHVIGYHLSVFIETSRFKCEKSINKYCECAEYNIQHGVHAYKYNLRNSIKKYQYGNGIANYLYAKIGLGLCKLSSLGLPSRDSVGIFFSLITFDAYRDKYLPFSKCLADSENIAIPIVPVYPESYRQNFNSDRWLLSVPSVNIIEIPKAEVVGKCDFIFTENKCLHHGLYRFDSDLCPEEMHGMVSINVKKGMLRRHLSDQDRIDCFPEAISMIGSTSGNYVHWLTETAPKLALIERDGLYKNMPIIIDDDLHPNIEKSIQCLLSGKREIIKVKRGQIVRVGRLIVVTPVAYIPFDFRWTKKDFVPEINPGLAMYVPQALNSLREKVVSRLNVDGDIPRPKRLYLRRTAKSRPMKNASEVEAMVRKFGFHIVEPEKLNFIEQVKLFSEAELILGQGGAAFGNIIFAPKGCHVVILTTWSPFTIFYYFSNLASVLGQRCSFVMCDPVEEADGFHPAHKGLNVNIPFLKKALAL